MLAPVEPVVAAVEPVEAADVFDVLDVEVSASLARVAFAAASVAFASINAAFSDVVSRVASVSPAATVSPTPTGVDVTVAAEDGLTLA